VAAIVEQLMTVENKPLEKIKTQIEQKKLVISDLGTIKSKVATLQDALTVFQTPSTFNNSNVVAGNKTNFDKVKEFNRAFDMVPLTPETYSKYFIDCDINVQVIDPCVGFTSRSELFIKSPNIIKLRLDLIKEEIEELNDAIKNKDFIETRDAIADILYVVYGMADVLGFDINILFNLNYVNQYFALYRVDIVKLISNFTENGLLNDNVSIFSKIKTLLQIDSNNFLEIDIEQNNLSTHFKLEHLRKKINFTYNILEKSTLKYLEKKRRFFTESKN
jgi:predicted HAD superfamily Cof-like phosphohydrolase